MKRTSTGLVFDLYFHTGDVSRCQMEVMRK